MKYSDQKALVQELTADTAGFDALGLLKYAAGRFAGRIALASSLSAEDQVLTDMLCRIGGKVGIFTLDTGRLPEETYGVLEATRRRYNVEVEVLFPERKAVEEMVKKHGPNLFYGSIEARKLCCTVRKIEPLVSKLGRLDAWICGLRAEQSLTRTGLQRIEWDGKFGLLKVSPLADWTTEQVWDYIRSNDVPYNELHDKGYPSIGCEPCTRAVQKGEDIRTGRWWWEQPQNKECGLHLSKVSNTDDSEARD